MLPTASPMPPAASPSTAPPTSPAPSPSHFQSPPPSPPPVSPPPLPTPPCPQLSAWPAESDPRSRSRPGEPTGSAREGGRKQGWARQYGADRRQRGAGAQAARRTQRASTAVHAGRWLACRAGPFPGPARTWGGPHRATGSPGPSPACGPVGGAAGRHRARGLSRCHVPGPAARHREGHDERGREHAAAVPREEVCGRGRATAFGRRANGWVGEGSVGRSSAGRAAGACWILPPALPLRNPHPPPHRSPPSLRTHTHTHTPTHTPLRALTVIDTHRAR
jgi:hypothetical protein